METKQISKAVIKRLPRYYRYLGELMEDNVERISSNELSKKMHTTASQIRQDLNNFGGFGQQGYGYNVHYLYTEIGKILGLDTVHPMIILGAGFFSHTKRCSFPTESSSGISSSFTTCPFLKRTPFFSSFMICVISWHRMCPTASSVLISFIQNPFPVLLFLQSVVLYIQSALFVKICCRHHKRNA